MAFYTGQAVSFSELLSALKTAVELNGWLTSGNIIYKNDYIDVIIYLYVSDEKNENPLYFLDNEKILELRERKINSSYLKPKKDAEDVNMFYKKKVVITGIFDYFVDRNDLAKIFKEITHLFDKYQKNDFTVQIESKQNEELKILIDEVNKVNTKISKMLLSSLKSGQDRKSVV